MKRANYHTHTVRCKHARGSERDYIEAALSVGMGVLGFSDHVPQPYNGDIVSIIRMDMSELPGYFLVLQKLREEYEGRIEIKIGFEVEYIRGMFDKLMQILDDYPVDYLIMGQHFIDGEYPGKYAGIPTEDPERLGKYVDQVLEGLKTGRFAYLAHPDVLNFIGDAGAYREHMGRLCAECRRLKIPLEINRLGFYEKRRYPNELFWKIAAQEGNEVIIGYDAHYPEALSDETTYLECVRWARELGLNLNEEYRI